MTIKGGPQGPMRVSMSNGMMHMEAGKMNMAALAESITRFVDRPVVDMTELKGDYQIVLDISMQDLQNMARALGGGAMAGPAEGKASTEASDPAGASIFASVQQMGLKLEARKAPMEMIVIDHCEKAPTAN